MRKEETISSKDLTPEEMQMPSFMSDGVSATGWYIRVIQNLLRSFNGCGSYELKQQNIDTYDYVVYDGKG